MKREQQEIIRTLRRELGNDEDTEHLVDWLLDAWATLAVLRERFGEEKAMQLYTASVLVSLPSKHQEAIPI